MNSTAGKSTSAVLGGISAGSRAPERLGAMITTSGRVSFISGDDVEPQRSLG